MSWASSSKIFKAPWFFKIPKTTYPMAQYHISEDVHRQQHCCEKVISHRSAVVSAYPKKWSYTLFDYFWNWTSLYFRTRCDHKIQHMSSPQWPWTNMVDDLPGISSRRTGGNSWIGIRYVSCFCFLSSLCQCLSFGGTRRAICWHATLFGNYIVLRNSISEMLITLLKMF
jgi:hypothetical protein